MLPDQCLKNNEAGGIHPRGSRLRLNIFGFDGYEIE